MVSKAVRETLRCALSDISVKNNHYIYIMLRPKGIYNFYVYIITNKTKTVLYTGVTNNLKRRLQEHQEGKSNFSSRYNVKYLLYYEHFGWINEAIAREKEIKGWSRKKKEILINKLNPDWCFLNERFA